MSYAKALCHKSRLGCSCRTRLSFFQGPQTKPKSEEFCGYQPERTPDSDWTALITMLLLKWLYHLSKATWSFSNLASMLRLNLFSYWDLRRWPKNPSAHCLWSPWQNSLA